ncbi:MAG TPA: DJ-1/PfpI family protein [Candidatus Binatia bacterium]|jgi:cyclohexyl-isocyanide hydratase|nr:DJ-1/PfpI family protein [Candidatus Binatia bacterium]
MLIFPKMTQLDFTGPFEVFARIPETKVHVLWKRIEPVSSDTGLAILPTTTLADCPELDLICIPGGPGQVAMMDDEQIITFVREKGERAKFVTSVCTGSLILGAAGLLKGYKAGTHWMSRDQLLHFGATPVASRIVVDRNRITGGGVTAGIDFGLYVAGLITNEPTARAIQLALEYNPEPPFNSGSPENAGPEAVAAARQRAATLLSERLAATKRAAARLGLPTAA